MNQLPRRTLIYEGYREG